MNNEDIKGLKKIYSNAFDVKTSSVINYTNEDIITQILVLSKESSRLSALRDTLLPKLMSGQIKL